MCLSIRYENTIEDLSRECSSLQAQLQARTESIQQHTASAEELRAELVRMEGQIDEERERAESTKDRLETEVIFVNLLLHRSVDRDSFFLLD